MAGTNRIFARLGGLLAVCALIALMGCTSVRRADKNAGKRTGVPMAVISTVRNTLAQVPGEPWPRAIPQGAEVRILKTPEELTHSTLYSQLEVVAWPDPLPDTSVKRQWIEPGTTCYAVYNELVERDSPDYKMEVINLDLRAYPRSDGTMRIKLTFYVQLFNKQRHTLTNRIARGMLYVLAEDGALIHEHKATIGASAWHSDGDARGDRVDNILLTPEQTVRARYLAIRTISEVRGITLGTTTKYLTEETRSAHPGVVLALSSEKFLSETAPRLSSLVAESSVATKVEDWTVLRLP